MITRDIGLVPRDTTVPTSRKRLSKGVETGGKGCSSDSRLGYQCEIDYPGKRGRGLKG